MNFLKCVFGTSMSRACVLIALALLSLYLVKVLHFKPDNPIEQVVEEAIDESTGIKIDLTPEEEK